MKIFLSSKKEPLHEYILKLSRILDSDSIGEVGPSVGFIESMGPFFTFTNFLSNC